MVRKSILTLLFVVLGTGAASACPDWQLAPSFGSTELTEGFPNDPWHRSITAGGNQSISRCFQDNSLAGSSASAPDFDLYYRTSGNTQLKIYVRSDYDTVLLVSDPYGEWWFDDDSAGGHDPMVIFPYAADGLYNIWIGSYERRSGQPATLIFTER